MYIKRSFAIRLEIRKYSYTVYLDVILEATSILLDVLNPGLGMFKTR
jgi:hypothetical protein